MIDDECCSLLSSLQAKGVDGQVDDGAMDNDEKEPQPVAEELQVK